jgi:hypothetical protein
MKRNANMKAVLIGCTLLVLLCLLTGAAGCNSWNRVGRFQLVATGSDPYVIDTTTGQAWHPGTGMFRSSKTGHDLSGRIGRFKLVATGSDSYIIDTATGKVWTPDTGQFLRPKK